MTALLIVLALAFAWTIGSHYTGACMGMPVALGAVAPRRALALMAPLALAGAALASAGVARTVGHDLVRGRPTRLGEAIVVAAALTVTAAFNRLRVPTSTIQILVAAVVGVAVASSTGVHWATLLRLLVLWVAAPPVAAALGWLGAQLLGPLARWERIGLALLLVGCAASFAMGANDVANASGALVGPDVLGAHAAGLLCGVALALGVLVTGRPLLSRVAFEIVDVDRTMATAAQLVQAAVVLVAVAFGLFTSMNQALVGAMAGAGVARDRRAVHRQTLVGILRGWVTGPPASFALALAAAYAVRAGGGAVTH